MMESGFLIFSLLFSPFARASWDLWAQTLLHLAALGFLMAGLFFLLRKRCLAFFPRDIWILSLALLGWNILSALFAVYPHQAILETLNLANGLVIFFVACRGGLPWPKGRILLGAISIYLVITSISTDNPFRIASAFVMVNPNILAGYLAACCVVMLEGALEAVSRRGRILFLIALAFCLFGIILAKSTGGFLAALVGVAFWFGKKTRALRRKLILGGILLLLGVGLFKFSRPEGKNRILWWKTAIRMTWTHPILGVGPGGYEHAHLYFRPAKGLNTIYPHSEPLRVTSETGLVGFFLWTGLLAMIFRRALKNGNPGPLGMMVALLFHNLYDYSLSIFACQILFWAAAGWAAGGRGWREVRLSEQTAKAGGILASLGLAGLTIFIWNIFLANRHTAKGEIALAERRVVEAKTHFEKAIGLWPLNPSDLIGLARVHLGPPEEPLIIRSYLEEAKALDRYGLAIRARSEEQGREIEK